MGGTSGRPGSGADDVTASARTEPALTNEIDEPVVANTTCGWPPSRSVIAADSPRYGTWIILTPAIMANSSPAKWPVEPLPPEPMLILSGFAFRVGDELGQRFGGDRRVHHHQQRRTHGVHDGREVGDEVVGQVAVQRRVDRIDRVGHEQRVAIRRRMGGEFGADIVVAAGPVLGNEGLTELIREPLRQHAGDDIGRTAGGRSDDDAHRPRRIGIRPRGRDHGVERRDARSPAQKLTAANFHGVSLAVLRGGRARLRQD